MKWFVALGARCFLGMLGQPSSGEAAFSSVHKDSCVQSACHMVSCSPRTAEGRVFTGNVVSIQEATIDNPEEMSVSLTKLP